MGNRLTKPIGVVCSFALMTVNGCTEGGTPRNVAKGSALDIPRAQIEQILRDIQRALVEPSSKCRLRAPMGDDLREDLEKAGPQDILGYARYYFGKGSPSIQLHVKNRNWPEEDIFIVVDLEHGACDAFDAGRGIRLESVDFPPA